jgi:hypothetical protein
MSASIAARLWDVNPNTVAAPAATVVVFEVGTLSRLG